MKKILILLSLLAAPLISVTAQDENEHYLRAKPVRLSKLCKIALVENGEPIYDVVEENASFPGGDVEMMKWMQRNLIYPLICQDTRVQGLVIVGFDINRKGNVTNVKILNSPDDNLSKEAKRLVTSMPKWKPARIGNKPVSSRFELPIEFMIKEM